MAAKGGLNPNHELRSNGDLVGHLSGILKSKEGEVET
jgi:hypothetical protein